MAGSKGLGRGLDTLFGFQETTVSGNTRLVPIQKIEPNPNQPRKRFDPEQLQSLADSIAMHGLIQPLTVRQTDTGYFEIIAGERRWRAARMAGLQELPVVVMEADDKTVTELALVENLQRSDLNPVEEALGFQHLMEDYSLTQDQAAERVGKSRPAVANALRLLALPKQVLELLEAGTITAGHARAVLQLKTEKQQCSSAQKIAALQLSVRQAELMCKSLAKEPKPVKEEPFRVDYVADCERKLTQHLGRGVKIEMGRRKGHLNLEFYGQDDLQVLLDALQALEAKRKK
ncbi:MAG: ParB/RepB/Spo0J family partition protein [Oscillospiraceae bacterium]|nr:ParB/RepB/Spo0J family partition protein [Oscillospiraceae bacterium]